ncbi:MAG: DnaJ C-terminal domain-containing protein [Paracoccus sp. (in: a-proteobacteria)]|uniref:DnaJ C-terminal domain-containing protein n=1 Tax=Paracoccus sp. TaxID=267 RepID=UPI0026E0F07F|nr:DnaJ C-terminal domain-containing protein [Paracoccus sp. (in: a-proteobacteria)]MDO5620483.1 DnaJ C-terminal domain-containing protein [Paracoccus sp. (in: a-proteobacteria)]
MADAFAADPYVALGISKTASDAEIKKAYRKIAKADHPDLNPDPAAAERFKAASAAYDLLKDPETRRRFDAGEIDASGQERPQQRYYRDYAGQADNPYAGGFSGGSFSQEDLSSVFDDLFGARAQARQGAGGFKGFEGFGGFGGRQGGGPMRGQDHRYDLSVDFLTAAKGGTARINLPEAGALEVKIPEGARDGQTIRLRGKGGAGMGNAPSGDAYLKLHVADHPHFRREGDDIFLILPITIDEAVLGGKVPVPTISGPVSLTIPKGASSGQKLRLRGRGVAAKGGKAGDQHVELRIVMPPQVDDELADFMESWRKTHSYDPRKGMA